MVAEYFENAKTVATTLRSALRFKGVQLIDEPPPHSWHLVHTLRSWLKEALFLPFLPLSVSCQVTYKEERTWSDPCWL